MYSRSRLFTSLLGPRHGSTWLGTKCAKLREALGDCCSWQPGKTGACDTTINCRRELDVSYCKSAHRKKTEPASTDTSGLRGGQDGGERRALPLPKAGWAEGRAACQPSRAGRRGAQGRPGPGQAAPHAISARGAVSGPRSSGGQAGRQAGGSQGGGGPETPRGTAARVTELPRPRRPLARLRTATEAPANGRGGARARPSPAPRCG